MISVVEGKGEAMSDYIKRSDMRAIFQQSHSLTQAWNGFDMLPSADVVERKDYDNMWSEMAHRHTALEAELYDLKASVECKRGKWIEHKWIEENWELGDIPKHSFECNVCHCIQYFC